VGVNFKGLAKDVKLSADGRQPTLFLSFADTSPIVFHDAYFYYTAGVVLHFSGQVFLCQSLGQYFLPHLFLSTQYCISIYTLGTMYHSTLGVGKTFFCPVVHIVNA